MTTREHDTVQEIDLKSAQGVVTCEIDDDDTVKINEETHQRWMDAELDRLDVEEVCRAY